MLTDTSSNPFLQDTHLAPAIVFVFLWALVFGWLLYLLHQDRFKTHSYRYLAGFAIVRVIAYILKAVISQPDNDTENNVIVAGIFLGSGFFLLVTALSSLLKTLSWYLEAQHHPEISQKSIDLSAKVVARYIPIAIIAASSISAAGAALLAMATTQSDVNQATDLRKAGAFIYLFVIAIIGFRLLHHVIEMRRAMNYSMTSQQLVQFTALTRIMLWNLPVSVFLIIRTIYSILTLYVSNVDFDTDDGFYTLYTTLEYVSVCWLAFPYNLRRFEQICRGEDTGEIKNTKSPSWTDTSNNNNQTKTETQTTTAISTVSPV
jgi:hypothetical protein